MGQLSNIMTSLAACLKVELEDENGNSNFCFIGIVPGDGVAQNYAIACQDQCGVAWVRMVTAYPATSPGQQAPRTTGCGAFVGVDLEVGILRCYSPYANDQGDALDEAAMLNVAMAQADDVERIRKVIMCCADSDDDVELDYTLGNYSPTPPIGGLAGGAWQLSLVI